MCIKYISHDMLFLCTPLNKYVLCNNRKSVAKYKWRCFLWAGVRKIDYLTYVYIRPVIWRTSIFNQICVKTYNGSRTTTNTISCCINYFKYVVSTLIINICREEENAISNYPLLQRKMLHISIIVWIGFVFRTILIH